MLRFTCQTAFFFILIFSFIARDVLGWEGKENQDWKYQGSASKGEQIVLYLFCFAFLAHLSIRFWKTFAFPNNWGIKNSPPGPSLSMCATKQNFLHKQGMLIVTWLIHEMEQRGCAWWRDVITWTPACTPALSLRKAGFINVLECKSTVSSGFSSRTG